MVDLGRSNRPTVTVQMQSVPLTFRRLQQPSHSDRTGDRYSHLQENANISSAWTEGVFAAPTAARRPVARFLNANFGMAVQHNDLFDLLTHMLLVAGCALACASMIGVTFNLTPQTVSALAFSFGIGWHLTEEDGFLNN